MQNKKGSTKRQFRRESGRPARSGSSGHSTGRPSTGRATGGATTGRERLGASRDTAEEGATKSDLVKFYGRNACLALYDIRRQDIRRVFIAKDMEGELNQLRPWCMASRIPFKRVPADELARIAATEHHEGVCIEALPVPLLSLSELLKSLEAQKRPAIAYLEGVGNPHNLGAILRTCAFFGVNGVIVQAAVMRRLPGSACRIAEGGAERVPIAVVEHSSEVVPLLREAGWTLLASDPHESKSVYEVAWSQRTVIIFGAEYGGISRELLETCDMRVAVPGGGRVESLNVGVAAGIVLAEWRRCSHSSR